MSAADLAIRAAQEQRRVGGSDTARLQQIRESLAVLGAYAAVHDAQWLIEQYDAQALALRTVQQERDAFKQIAHESEAKFVDFVEDWERAEDEAQSLRADVARLTATKDDAYLERNHLVAALAHLFPSGTRATDIPGWSPDWHGCVTIDLPSGQISYHYHDSHAHLFADLPPYTKPWDGHDKAMVHQRLAELKPTHAEQQLTALRASIEQLLHANGVLVVWPELHAALLAAIKEPSTP